VPADTFPNLPRDTAEPHDEDMTQIKGDTRPEDSIIGRYMPSASDAEREEAREGLRRLVRLLIRVHLRLASEITTKAIRDNAYPAVESEHPTKII
jgi:hypothetical protein